MLEQAHKFDLTLISMAPNFAEMLLDYLRTVADKDCAPEVLYERVSEKFLAHTVIVFSEDA